MMESDWLGDTCFRLSALVAQSKNKSSGSTNTNHTCCISHVDGGVLKILPVCLSLGQWKSLIRPWPANERRWVDGPGEEAKRKAISGNDYRLISLFILPLKRERETPPALHHPPRSSIYCVTTADPPLPSPTSPVSGPHWSVLNHSCSVLLYFYSRAFADLFHSLNKQCHSFRRPFSPFLFLSLFPALCSIVESRVPLVNNFPPDKIKLGPQPFSYWSSGLPGPLSASSGWAG